MHKSEYIPHQRPKNIILAQLQRLLIDFDYVLGVQTVNEMTYTLK